MKMRSVNDIRRERQQKQFLSENEARLAELKAFNQGVSTRQVRRLYARVMAKRK